MANKKISQLNELSTTPASDDVLAIVDISDNTTKKITYANLVTTGGTPGGSTTQLQYNNANAFGGISTATFNNTTGDLTLGGGVATALLSGGEVTLNGGNSAFDSRPGGDIVINGGTASVGDAGGGNIYLIPGAKAGSGTEGKVHIKDVSSTISAILNTDSLATSDKTFTFPNASGTIALTGLAGTKVYYTADSSGGAVTRKLTFTNGILISET